MRSSARQDLRLHIQHKRDFAAGQRPAVVGFRLTFSDNISLSPLVSASSPSGRCISPLPQGSCTCRILLCILCPAPCSSWCFRSLAAGHFPSSGYGSLAAWLWLMAAAAPCFSCSILLLSLQFPCCRSRSCRGSLSARTAPFSFRLLPLPVFFLCMVGSIAAVSCLRVPRIQRTSCRRIQVRASLFCLSRSRMRL